MSLFFLGTNKMFHIHMYYCQGIYILLMYLNDIIENAQRPSWNFKKKEKKVEDKNYYKLRSAWQGGVGEWLRSHVE